ncbi:MAG: hypothetical protein N838_14175 [Thiohalocapsa sp. PB-PSB1]|jgi:hypothetical protein|nr:MAG: hypothetical protein N838_06415 [Thiohalocapsa sp. PB-PSB1]QQO54314.1 MAG: hypothetical protein N838_14175 [Thiohalocapsa sp. PB-PSB1]
MTEETNEPLDKTYDELKQLRDEIRLKLQLGGMEVRDEWEKLEGEWDTWTHQLGQQLEAKAEDLEQRLREAGGEDLRKLEVATKLEISKLKRGFQEVADNLTKD